MKVVKDLRVLKAIIKRSVTELKVCSKFRYIEQGVIITPVEYKGKKYVTRYFDGCFYPYIVELSNKTIKI